MARQLSKTDLGNFEIKNISPIEIIKVIDLFSNRPINCTPARYTYLILFTTPTAKKNGLDAQELRNNANIRPGQRTGVLKWRRHTV